MATRWRLCVCSLGLLLLAPCALAEKFSLAGSQHPVVGVIGQEVVLPCQLSPPARLSNMEVLWRKIGTEFIPVHEYSDVGPKDQTGEGYQSRTELFPQEFSNGNVSLKLKRLQMTDGGRYHCYVKNLEWSQETTTELQVAAVAPVFIDVLGPQNSGIGLACRSTGWFPKPELQWVGKNLEMEFVTDVTQDTENLYSVVSYITVTEKENSGDISCIVQNGLLEPERQSAIHLTGGIFPQVSPWLIAFLILLALALIGVGACAYLGYTAKRKVSQKKRSEEEAPLTHGDKRKVQESEFQYLHKKIATQENNIQKLETECQQLRKTKELQEIEIKELKSESQENEIKQLKSEKEEEIETKPSPLHSPSPGLRNDSMELAAAATSHPVLPLDEEKKEEEEIETAKEVTEAEKKKEEEIETAKEVTEAEKEEQNKLEKSET
nr:butyrophilin subfamily 3 member A2-like [Pelodiscus sinensis]|eukprot:XP_025039250.1 butyrophilin subfamily 3 member A2-like [Pelodiscus sinensis]